MDVLASYIYLVYYIGWVGDVAAETRQSLRELDNDRTFFFLFFWGGRSPWLAVELPGRYFVRDGEP